MTGRWLRIGPVGYPWEQPMMDIKLKVEEVSIIRWDAEALGVGKSSFEMCLPPEHPLR